MIRKHIIVHGRVQGVGFRYSTSAEAETLGLSGYAKNLLDGTVEIEAEGEPGVVETLLTWLAAGPSWARVESMDVTDREPTGDAGFHIR